MARPRKLTDKPSKAQMQKALANISMHLRDNNRKEATLWAQTLVGYLGMMGLTESGSTSAAPLHSAPRPSTISNLRHSGAPTELSAPAENHSRNERGIHA